MKRKYDPVYLETEDRKRLREAVGRRSHSKQEQTRASILLALDENSGPVPDQTDIASVLKCSPSTVRATAKRFASGGADAVLRRKKRDSPPVPPKVTGEVEARIIKIACSKAPDGHVRWTLRLLEDTVATIADLPDLSDNTIGRLLKKHHLSLT
jgi:transposase